MELESYFDFLAPDDIRIKGTRVGIETVLYDHVHRGKTAEQIAAAYPHLSTAQVNATISLYKKRKEEFTRYIENWLEFGRKMRREQEQDPHFVQLRKKLREFKDSKTARA